MKKLLGIVVLGLILFAESANAKRTKMVSGKDYEGEITWIRNIKIKLPPGKFKLVDRYQWSSWGITANAYWFAKFKGNVWDEEVSLGLIGSTKYTAYLRQIYYEVWFKNKYDGCYPRSEYTLMKVKKKGGFFNCFKVRHIDIKKELYHPDDPRDTSGAYIKWYMKKHNLTHPAIAICATHWFFAASITEKVLGYSHCLNPETHGASKNKFTTEETSEYHPQNINNYPDKKKFMENFIKLAAQQHKLFEIGIGAKEHHKMDLSEYGVGEIIEETKTTNITSGSGISDEIKELKKLHEEGVLTDDEFEKAKKKVLSQ